MFADLYVVVLRAGLRLRAPNKKPLDIPPTDKRASERKERLMDVGPPLVSDAQSAKAV